jgi:hypothetical protein
VLSNEIKKATSKNIKAGMQFEKLRNYSSQDHKEKALVGDPNRANERYSDHNGRESNRI